MPYPLSKHLYIIGNGFDRHHDSDSNYSDFRKYLTRVNPKVVADFETFFGEGSLFTCRSHDALWADFEQNLSELDREKVFDYVDLLLPEEDIDDDAFLMSDFEGPISVVDRIVTSCTTEMQYHFHKWVNTLHYKHGFKSKMVKLDSEALFLNFNYTQHLETEYGIAREQILYIHGDRRDGVGELILGHNVEDSEEALQRWIHKHKNRRRYRHHLKDKNGRYFANYKLVYLAYFIEDHMRINCGKSTARFYAIEPIQEYLEGYYDQNVKHCQERIESNAGFFELLSEVEEITVLGHSLSDVDFAYFEKIVQVVGRRVKWNFSYYNDKDIARINKFCHRLKIPKPTGGQLFRMERIVRS